MRRYTILFCLFLALMAATRLPFTPGQLFSFDEINLVYGMDKLDIRLSQPQPPGYPLFIGEMHVMRWLRFVRPESNLIALAVLSGAFSLLALVWCGDRMFGGRAGLYGAILLFFHSSFWYTGLTSGLRVQLALISALTAGFAWRAWKGEPRGVFYGALVLGLGAGARPEIGPLLFPLWAVATVRSGLHWTKQLAALGLMAAAVLSWLTPVAQGSGGFDAYFWGCWEYLVGQGATTSPLFGLETPRWTATTIWLLVWTFSGLLFLPGMRWLGRGVEMRVGWERWFFFALWLGPSVLFALLVHVADPGHVLGMLAPVSLFLGYQVERAAAARDSWNAPSWRWVLPALITSVILEVSMIVWPDFFRLLVILLGGVTAVAYRWGRSRRIAVPVAAGAGEYPAAGLVLWPSVAFFLHALLAGHWYIEDVPFLSEAFRGMHVSTIDHVLEVVDPDDNAIQEAKGLAAEAPGRTMILWERGRTSWRKLSYYLPEVPVVVLERVPEGLSFSKWLRSVQSERNRGPAPLRVTVPAGARLIWFIQDPSEFTAALRRNLPVVQRGAILTVDLPSVSGSAALGDFVLAW